VSALVRRGRVGGEEKLLQAEDVAMQDLTLHFQGTHIGVPLQKSPGRFNRAQPSTPLVPLPFWLRLIIIWSTIPPARAVSGNIISKMAPSTGGDKHSRLGDA